MRVRGLPSTISRRESGRRGSSARRGRTCAGGVQRRRRRSGCCREGEAVVPDQGLAAACEPDPRARLLPPLDAGPARRRDRRPLEQHPVGLARPQLPDGVHLVRARQRGAAREPAWLPGPDLDSALPRGGRLRVDSLLRRPPRAHPREGHRRNRLHGQPGRRPVARAAGVASPRIALRAQPARSCAAHLRGSRSRPEADAARSRVRRPEPLMATTRRGFLTGAAAGALGAAGIYELVDRLTASPARTAAQGLPPEQHLLESVSVVRDEGVAVMVPPLHHQVVTAKVRATDLRRAQRDLEDALAGLDSRFEPTPAGLGVTVAWGLPYFERPRPPN